jgi:hypothetical protein
MSTAPSANREPLTVQPYHYQVLCCAGLGLIFFLMMQQGSLVFGMAVLLLGSSAVLLRVRVSPALVIVPLVGGPLYDQYLFAFRRPHRALEVEDVLLCAAALAYVAGHYRLLAIWSHILPPDPRQRYHAQAHSDAPGQRVGKVVPQTRPAALLSRGELAWFVLQLPLFALAAQGAWMAVGRRELHGLPVRWVQILPLLQMAWGLVFVMFLAGQFFRFWRILQMDRVTARLFLQEMLWHETRGEQRRIGRWLAWWHLRGR